MFNTFTVLLSVVLLTIIELFKLSLASICETSISAFPINAFVFKAKSKLLTTLPVPVKSRSVSFIVVPDTKTFSSSTLTTAENSFNTSSASGVTSDFIVQLTVPPFFTVLEQSKLKSALAP